VKVENRISVSNSQLSHKVKPVTKELSF